MAGRTSSRAAAKAAASKVTASFEKKNPKAEPNSKTKPAAKAKSKATLKPKTKGNHDMLPHGLGVKAPAEDQGLDDGITAQTELTIQTKESEPKDEKISDAAEDKPVTQKAAKVKKASQYGVQLGVTPYPDLLRPTPEECQVVHDLLTAEHGKVEAPQTIAAPSLSVAGCGEVKFILEAVLRTHISAHTSMSNANNAIKGLTAKFPLIKEGDYKGSVDWNVVRLAPQKDLEDAIRRGGMAPTKSKAIKAILDMVYEENQALKAELTGEVKPDSDVKMEGSEAAPATEEDAGDKVVPNKVPTKMEKTEEEAETIVKTEEESKTVKIEHKVNPKTPIKVLSQPLDTTNVTREAVMSRLARDVLVSDSSTLTLDYIHGMDEQEAFNKLLCYPGIGVKTAACTMLFCMQRPLFAVDTHVFRLCKWLGWVPENANRDTTFAHCDVRCPNELKYGLHQLLIRHGKDCEKCRAITGEASKGWDQVCVLEELVKRTGKKKGGVDPPKPKRKKGEESETEEQVGKGPNKKARGKKAVEEKDGKAKATPKGKEVADVDEGEEQGAEGPSEKALGKRKVESAGIGKTAKGKKVLGAKRDGKGNRASKGKNVWARLEKQVNILDENIDWEQMSIESSTDSSVSDSEWEDKEQ